MPERLERTSRVTYTDSQSGDWDEFYSTYAPRGLRYASSLVRCHADAEEVVHDAFCRLIQGRSHPSRKSGGDLAPLLFTTIRHLAIDLMRRRARQPRTTTMNQDEILDRHGNMDHDHPDGVAMVLRLLAQLPDTWREALQLRIHGELTYREIAQVLTCTPAQVRTWIYRARLRLAKELRLLEGRPCESASEVNYEPLS